MHALISNIISKITQNGERKNIILIIPRNESNFTISVYSLLIFSVFVISST